MPRRKYAAQIKNVYFLARIGQSLRWATSDIARDELPDEIEQLLWRLDRVEAHQMAAKQRRLTSSVTERHDGHALLIPAGQEVRHRNDDRGDR